MPPDCPEHDKLIVSSDSEADPDCVYTWELHLHWMGLKVFVFHFTHTCQYLLHSLRRVFNAALTWISLRFPFSTHAWFRSRFLTVRNGIGWGLIYSFFSRREKAKFKPPRRNPWLYGLSFLWKFLDYKAGRHVSSQTMTFLGVVYIIFDDWGLHVVLINPMQITDLVPLLNSPCSCVHYD